MADVGTLAPQLLVLPDWCLQVTGAFLDVVDLARCEQAKLFCPPMLSWLWEELASRSLKGSPLWGTSERRFDDLNSMKLDSILQAKLRDRGAVQQHFQDQMGGKRMVYELTLLRRALFPPWKWKPLICEDSFCSVSVHPLPESGAAWHDMGYADSNLPSVLPYEASIALASGAFHGHSYVVGVKVKAAGPMGDAVCLSIEAIEAHEQGKDARSMSVMFAPFSGRCFICGSEDGRTARTQPLAGISPDNPVYVWVQVSASGSIRFLRHVEGNDPEEAGYIPSSFLPEWVSEYFARLDFWCYDLEADVHASVEHAGKTFPRNMEFSEDPVPSARIDSWEVVDEQDWL